MSRRAMCGHSRTLKHIAELADAIRYALSRCKGLTRFLDDGRIELDNSPVEHSIRRQLEKCALRRLRRRRRAASLIETCKLTDIDLLA
jgi:transposase